ncbi:MAG TPA: response regulator [Spirochaetota bacterium]|nr:response regulator [Spirochaetota bacterium]HRZ26489.1 response regulator [Spirochaetota bacterium]
MAIGLLKKTLYAATFFLCFSSLLSCRAGGLPENGQSAVKGAVKISAAPPPGGRMKLDGEWEFYWNRLLEPHDFETQSVHDPAEYMEVPGSWKGRRVNSVELPGEGYATYRLTILNEDRKSVPQKISSLAVHGIYSAYRLWVNGVELSQSSIVDKSQNAREQYTFVYHTRTIPFQLRDGTNEIVIQVLNYHIESGGIGTAPVLGDGETELRNQTHSNIANMIVVSLSLFVSVYNILVFLYNRKDRAALYLGLFCLVWTVNMFNLLTPVINDYFADKRIPYQLDVITIILIGPLYLMAIQALYPEDVLPGIFTPVLRFTKAAAALCVVLVLFSGFKTSEKIIRIYYYFSIAGMVYFVWVFFRILYNRRNEALLFFIGFFSFFVVSINDILCTLQVINTAFVFQYGMLVFCFTTSLVVLRRFALALRKVDDLTVVLEEKNLALVKLDRLKDEFLANTSHELRTPLHGMIGLSESMIHGAAGDLPGKAVENLALIASSGYRLAGMVNDLLDMAKIQDERMSLDLRPVDLFSLTDMVVKLSLPLVGAKHLEIINEVEPGIPPVMADEERIRQVMHNLVGNAIKFSNSGTVRISASVTDRNNGNGLRMVEVRVADTGIGVPEEYREAIFEPYRQLDGGDTRRYPGTGLGLAIAKRIIELHDGSISASSGGDGSVFAFTLPVSQTMAVDDRHEAEKSIDPSILFREDTESRYASPETDDAVFDGNPVLLVVDDDPVNVRILQNYLESKRCVVKTAFDGVSALDILRNDGSIDLMLLDIMMPGISGYEVCKRVRIDRPADDLPVIMLTAKNMMSDISAAFEAGANDYIMKPFQVTELFARIKTMIKLKNIRRSEAESITIQTWNNVYSLRFGDIVYITSHSRNITVHTVGRDIEAAVRMKNIVDRLPPDTFMRIHKSYIVNINFIYNLQHVISGRYKVRLKDEDDTDLPVGPSYLEDLRKKLHGRN